jgi:hypothetical protein
MRSMLGFSLKGAAGSLTTPLVRFERQCSYLKDFVADTPIIMHSLSDGHCINVWSVELLAYIWPSGI